MDIAKPLSVGEYINFLNQQLSNFRARIQGEISSFDSRDRVIYFSIKDSKDSSVMNCLIWKNDYSLSGVEFKVGMEVILEGVPDIYKPSGRLSFKASFVELVGEGALKKSYDQLKAKLEAEGLFAIERKKRIPDLSEKIGLITSESGAVIHDFLTNLGKFGFNIKFRDSRVEGQAAVADLVAAIDYFSKQDIDVLVIIRGGGSMESLQAFNNEVLIRKIASFKKPVICGIGHEKDVPLASLVADRMVSTPTAVTHVLNSSWQELVQKFEFGKERILRSFQTLIFEIERDLIEIPKNLISIFGNLISNNKQNIMALGKLLATHDPQRQLKLGYSIVLLEGSVVKKTKQVKVGKVVNIMVDDGSFSSEVKVINSK